ncbi:MAG: glycosyltransferase [Bacteroidaceae bacterium]
MEKKKVLYIKYNLNMDGVTSLFLNMSNHWNQVEIDYLIDTKEVPPSIGERLRRTGTIYSIAEAFAKRSVRVPFFLYKLYYVCRMFLRGKYDVVHLHTGEIDRCIFLLLAMLCGIKTRIIHSHSAASETGTSPQRERLFKLMMKVSATHYFACSDVAAAWMFPKSVVDSSAYLIIRNGIDAEAFQYRPQQRKRMRDEMGLNGQFVCCSVGRLEKVKNYAFLLEVFDRILHRRSDSLLLLIGQGSERNQLQSIVAQKGIGEQVRFLGGRDDIPALLNAVDCFLLPSLFEGLPLTLVEAQVSGLWCLASDCVPRQVQITENVEFISLKETAETWADCALSALSHERTGHANRAVEAGYDVRTVVSGLEKFYREGIIG